MNTCAICNQVLDSITSCTSCNPLTRSSWSRKLTLFVGGSLAVWALIGILFFVGFSAWIITSGGASSQPVTALGAAAATLVLGLGGSVTGSASGFASAEGMFPNLIIPIALFGILSFIKRRFFARDEKNVVNGLMFSLGATSAMGFIALVATVASIATGATFGVGLSSLVPVLVVAAMSYISFSGTTHWPLLQKFQGHVAQQIGAINKFHHVLWRIAILGAFYYALTMGTGLNAEWDLWIWLAAGAGALLVMPTLAFLAAPIFLGVAISNTTIFSAMQGLAAGLGWKNDGQWLAWLIVSVAILTVLSSSLKSAALSAANENGWWLGAGVGFALGVSTTYFATAVAGASLFGYSLPITQDLSPTPWLMVAIFTAIGLIRGLLLHPAVKPLTSWLVGSVTPTWRKLLETLSLQNNGLRVKVQSHFAGKHIVVRKLAKYTIVSLLVTFFWVSGQPLAAVTSPLYDNAHKATDRFSSALKSGEVKDISDYFSNGTGTQVDAVFASTGLVDDSTLSVEALKTIDPSDKIAWANGAFYIEVSSTKSYTKAPFLGLIPQWDAAITSAHLPKATATYENQQVLTTLYKGRKVVLARTFFLPGQVTWTPETDKSGFVKAEEVKFDSTKNATFDLKFSLDSSKIDAIKASLYKDFQKQFTCKTATLDALKNTALGKYSNDSGLATINTSGTGKCDAGAGVGVIPFNYTAVGSYMASTKTWIWDFNFR